MRPVGGLELENISPKSSSLREPGCIAIRACNDKIYGSDFLCCNPLQVHQSHHSILLLVPNNTMIPFRDLQMTRKADGGASISIPCLLRASKLTGERR